MKRSLVIMALVFLAAVLLFACRKEPPEEGGARMEEPQREKLLYVACVDRGARTLTLWR